MHAARIVLLCFGLCLHQEIKAQMETLIKPSIWAEPSYIVAPGTNVTLHCWTTQSKHQEVTFTLLKAGIPEYYSQKLAVKKARFSLQSVSFKHAGSYSCVYSEKMDPRKKSKASDTLDLVVTGSLPKPSLLVFPRPEVELGESMRLRCIMPLKSSSQESMMFILMKAGIPEPVQSSKLTKIQAEFPFQSVRDQDAGYYRCIYYEKKTQPGASEPSEPLNICLTDHLTKPFLMVQPSSMISLGGNVIFHCQTATCGTRFTLYKEEKKMLVKTVNSTQDKGEFLITAVTKTHAGSYRCNYHTGENSSIPSEFSDPLELLVTGTSLTFENILIISLSCIIIFLFLVFLSYCLKHFMNTHQQTPQRDMRYQPHSGPSSVEVVYEVVSNMGRTIQVSKADYP